MASQQSHSAPYPVLSEAFPPDRQAQIIAMGHTEDRRSAIAQTEHGLHWLAVADQFVRALLELKIGNEQDAQSAHQSLDAALGMFKLRGLPTGKSPTPRQLAKAIERIAKSMRNIETDLHLLALARRDIGLGEQQRADSLQQIQHAILGSIAADILPTSLTRKFSNDEIAETMPTYSQTLDRMEFSFNYSGGFTKVADTVDRLAATFVSSELKKPTKGYDLNFTRFIGQLGGIFNQWIGEPPHAPDRNSNQGADWRGPFSRFVAAVWPLTPEGSGGTGGNRRCPTNKRIREALKQSALLPISAPPQ